MKFQPSSPFTQPSGVFEVQIAITDKKPSEESINKKNFPTLWIDDFHLRISENKFTEILGSEKNPIPKSVFDLESVWIVVSDQFSTIHTVFDIKLKKQVTAKPSKPAEPSSKQNSKRNSRNTGVSPITTIKS